MKIKIRYIVALSSILLFLIVSSMNSHALQIIGGRVLSHTQISQDTIYKQSKEQIILKHSDELNYNKNLRPDVQCLIGNVVFQHGKATMSCDSAYYNNQAQIFEAFGNIHMVQNDTVNMYANYLKYNGETQIAQFRDDVRLENSTTTLYTDSLNYNRNQNIGYYFNGGSIVDSLNTLQSAYGQYNTTTNNAEFLDSVKLTNAHMTMTTQHLSYNTKSKIAGILGPTLIVSDSGIIRSNRGIYDTKNNVAILLDQSHIQSGTKILTGDSIYYDGIKKFGEAFGNISIKDTVQKIELHGNYGYFDEHRNYAFATDHCYALDYSNPKDTTYLRGDTLELITKKYTSAQIERIKLLKWSTDSIGVIQRYLQLEYSKIGSKDSIIRNKPLKLTNKDKSTPLTPKDSVLISVNDRSKSIKFTLNSKKNRDSLIILYLKQQFLDTIKIDSNQRILKAYHHVKIFSKNQQSISDSLVYQSIDSCLRLFGTIRLWQGNNQLSGNMLTSHIHNGQIDYTDLIGNVISIQHLDSANIFNQLKSDTLHAIFQKGKLVQTNSQGNVVSIFYLYDKKSNMYTGMNRMNSTQMNVYLKNRTIQKVVAIGPVTGDMYPMFMSEKPDINRVDGFLWNPKLRPTSKESIINADTTQNNTYHYTLQSLSKYSGALAAMKAYGEIPNRTDTITTDSIKINNNGKEQSFNTIGDKEHITIHYYVLTKEKNKKILSNPIYTDRKSWLYHFSIKEKHENSIIAPYIGMQEKKNLKNESNK